MQDAAALEANKTATYSAHYADETTNVTFANVHNTAAPSDLNKTAIKAISKAKMTPKEKREHSVRAHQLWRVPC